MSFDDPLPPGYSPHLPGAGRPSGGTPGPPDPDGPDRGPVSWPTVLGLGATALLWPLTGLLGVDPGAPRALTLVVLTAALWIGVVGLGRVARPVLTLTLVGITYGVVAAAVSALVGVGTERPAWTLVPALALHAGWGALAGLVAAAVQRRRGRSDR